jgi:hypothetical protein
VCSAPSTRAALFRRLLGLYLLLSYSVWAGAVSPAGTEPTERFLKAAGKFEDARAGSSEATPEAQAAFRDLLAADPNNPLYRAYYASTLAMQARDSRLPWQRINLIRESIVALDKALGMLKPQDDLRLMRGMPLSLETRLVAIATFVALPEVFHRLPVAKQQLAIAMGSPSFATAPAELRGRFYYELALVAQAEGRPEAERTALRQVLLYAPASLDLAEVRARLTKLGMDMPASTDGSGR